MEINKERIVNQFLKLVKINSPSRNERELADYLKRKLGELGITVKEDNVGGKFNGNTGNLIGTYSGEENLPTIFLAAHMDIVRSAKGINPIVEEGIIKTDGSTILGGDDKAGITAILETIQLLKESEIKHGNLEIIFTAGEEIGLFGAKYLDENTLEAEFGFVLDSGGPVDKIIVSAPTEKDFDIEITGKAAHAGVEPEKGISAIEVGCDIITQLKLGKIDEETTANIGVIEGGEATNIVADKLSIKGEARSRDEEKLEQIITEIQDICSKKEEEWEAKIELNITKAYSNFKLTKEDEVVKVAMQSLKDIGLDPKLRPRGGGSDANIFNEKGIPTVNLGIGVKNDHTTKEQIAIEDLVKCTNLVVKIIENVGK
ncbi:M20/M25/M40 family metallo-hydrolase [Selenihalanaerobacter shriftii]|uniref:Peptidase T-like protein n=1 Tax=Selenihalanaerobacter shriftii TaxID=142842 RepID=A0A1T4M4R6_9FIRM|nr:M20/M25/M40 family metallo-hydrolase [Selenihalanaerobacter shriftii]SJZ61867.1 peptidase T-like protein [Selenihalanaerobacter shriftii]